MYRIEFTRAAQKDLRRVSCPQLHRIQTRLVQLAVDPYRHNPAVKKLQGKQGYRLRVGDWRVIYELYDDRLLVLVVAVAPRGQIYKR